MKIYCRDNIYLKTNKYHQDIKVEYDVKLIYISYWWHHNSTQRWQRMIHVLIHSTKKLKRWKKTTTFIVILTFHKNPMVKNFASNLIQRRYGTNTRDLISHCLVICTCILYIPIILLFLVTCSCRIYLFRETPYI